MYIENQDNVLKTKSFKKMVCDRHISNSWKPAGLHLYTVIVNVISKFQKTTIVHKYHFMKTTREHELTSYKWWWRLHKLNGYRSKIWRTIWFQNPALRLFLGKVCYPRFAHRGQIAEAFTTIRHERPVYGKIELGNKLSTTGRFVSASGAQKVYRKILFTGLNARQLKIIAEEILEHHKQELQLMTQENKYLTFGKRTRIPSWSWRRIHWTLVETKQSLWMDYGKITWQVVLRCQKPNSLIHYNMRV